MAVTNDDLGVLKRLTRCPVCEIVDVAAEMAEHLAEDHGWSTERINRWLRGVGGVRP